jgi:hypothetical protein
LEKAGISNRGRDPGSVHDLGLVDRLGIVRDDMAPGSKFVFGGFLEIPVVNGRRSPKLAWTAGGLLGALDGVPWMGYCRGILLVLVFAFGAKVAFCQFQGQVGGPGFFITFLCLGGFHYLGLPFSRMLDPAFSLGRGFWAICCRLGFGIRRLGRNRFGFGRFLVRLDLDSKGTTFAMAYMASKND